MRRPRPMRAKISRAASSAPNDTALITKIQVTIGGIGVSSSPHSRFTPEQSEAPMTVPFVGPVQMRSKYLTEDQPKHPMFVPAEKRTYEGLLHKARNPPSGDLPDRHPQCPQAA